MENIVMKSESVKSITDFKDYSLYSGIFVRIIGEDSKLLSDIYKMDSELSLSVLSGNVAYKRINSLPNITMPDDIDFYTQCYNDWIRCGRRRMLSKRLFGLDKADEKLADAVCEVMFKLKILRPMLTESMEKNAVIKLLYRYDEVMKDFSDKKGFTKNAKIVSDNVTKEQDYLFFYLLALLGINVLLIQNRSDIDIYQKQLGISAINVIGHLGSSILPEYRQPQALKETRSNDRQRISTDTSVRPNQIKVQNAQSGNTLRVTIPPRPTKRKPPQNNLPLQPVRNNTAAVPSVPKYPQDNTRTGNVRVTLPPRPEKRRNNIMVQSVPPFRTVRQNPAPSFAGSGYSPTVTTTPPQYNNRRIAPFGTTVAGAAQNRRELSYEQLARLAVSIVQIMVFKNPSRGNPVSSGSGIMIGEQGYILTNCHVTDSGKVYGIRIENDNNIYYTDRVIKYHRDLDLSVLKIEKHLNPLPIYKGKESLCRGQRVVAIGSPLGMFNTVSDGIISGFREIDGVKMIQFTAPISAGSSGGAVLNMYGEVVGISTAGLRYGQNINLAVPYNEINLFCLNFI